jgi:hypothetical protein
VESGAGDEGPSARLEGSEADADPSPTVSESLTWLIDPLSPGLRTRIEMFTFVPSVSAGPVAAGAADGASEDVISAPVGSDTTPEVPLSCATVPSVPGLSTRTETSTLPSSVCVEMETVGAGGLGTAGGCGAGTSSSGVAGGADSGRAATGTSGTGAGSLSDANAGPATPSPSTALVISAPASRNRRGVPACSLQGCRGEYPTRCATQIRNNHLVLRRTIDSLILI